MRWKLPLTTREAGELRDLNDRLNSIRRIMATLMSRRKRIMTRAENRAPKKPIPPRQPSLF